MKLSFKISENPTNLLRRAGYSYKYTEQCEMSFVREFGRSGYPRFHMFVRMDGATMLMSIHLDQKKETYGDSARHHGEYEDSPALQQEADRLTKILNPNI